MPEDSRAPLVTVVCSTYNCKKLLRFALRSVLAQDFGDFEVQVIGDACTDGSEEVVAQLNDRRLHWFNLPKNSGNQSVPNNEGIRRARGRYIAMIGHDDLWRPLHLSQLVRQIEQTGADFVHDLIVGFDYDGVESVGGPPHPRSNYIRVHVPPSCWLHRRSLPEEIGFWRSAETLSWAIDYDFTRRAALAGKKMECVPSLGVLKFYSPFFKSYAPREKPVQEDYLAAILNDPQKLNDEILRKLAVILARNSQWESKKPLNLAWDETKLAGKGFMKACLREMIYLYGEDRWPLGNILRKINRRRRSRLRLKRGLRTLEESGL